MIFTKRKLTGNTAEMHEQSNSFKLLAVCTRENVIKSDEELTGFSGRRASESCLPHRSRRWRRPPEAWWRTSSAARTWPCLWSTGQRSWHHEDLASKNVKQYNFHMHLLRRNEIVLHHMPWFAWQTKHQALFLVCSFHPQTCKHHHVLKVGGDLVSAAQV